MKRNLIIIRIIGAHTGIIILVLSIIKSLEFFLITLFTGNATFFDYIANFNDFLLTAIIPMVIVFETLFTIFLLPIQKAVNMITDKKTVDTELLKKAKNRIFKLPMFSVIINSVGFVGGFFLYFLNRTELATLFKMQEFIYLIFAVASAGVYAFIQVTVCNQILSEPREMLNIYYLNEKESSREISLRMRTILLTVLLACYSLSFFIFGQTWVYESETYSAYLLENVNDKKLTIDEATTKYINFMNPLTQGKQAQFSYNTETYEQRKEKYNRYFLTTLFALLFINFSTVFMFSKELISQISKQHDTLRNILLGKENLSKRMNIIQNDEVGFLTSTINKLMDKLKDILMKIGDSSNEVVDSSINLDQNIHLLSSASEEIFASINQINTNTHNQIDVVSETNKKLMIMLSSINKISENVRVQTSFVEETSSAVHEMAQSINHVNSTTNKASEVATNLVKVANEGGKAVEDTIIAIKNIEKASEAVKEIIEVISGISSQTNLLSMNASIEAAHAGSAGKGFAVVAEEIRKLAEDSAEQAGKINQHIQNMYNTVLNGVKMSGEAEDAFKRITEDVRITTDLITEVSGAMQEQNVGTNQILTSITNLVNSTAEVKDIADQLKQASESIKSTMEELELISSEIKNSTNEQEVGIKEVLEKVNYLKDISVKNAGVVRRLQSITADFSFAEIGLKAAKSPETQNFGVTVVPQR
ncbi:MAG: hypothetical protein JXJ04_13295 [Spirochaetales bacterium]|nr:hypothetical protein [Spirochaetales bacterium]